MSFTIIAIPPPDSPSLTPEEKLLQEISTTGEKMTLVEFYLSCKDGFLTDQSGKAYYGDRSGPSLLTITCVDAVVGLADYSYTHIFWVTK